MIEQVSNSIKFGVQFIAAKVGKTGIAVTVDVFAPDDSKIVNNANATEIGDGLYRYILSGTLTGTEGLYIAVFKTADATVDQQYLPAAWAVGVAGVEKLDAAVSSRNAIAPPTSSDIGSAVWDASMAAHIGAGSTGQVLSAAGSAGDPLINTVPGNYPQNSAGRALGMIANGIVNTISPITQDGDVKIIQGDDYLAADGKALRWIEDSAGWPTLTGASISVVVGDGSPVAGSVLVATGSGKEVQVEFHRTDTSAMGVDDKTISVTATLQGGSVVTLVKARAIVSKRN